MLAGGVSQPIRTPTRRISNKFFMVQSLQFEWSNLTIWKYLFLRQFRRSVIRFHLFQQRFSAGMVKLFSSVQFEAGNPAKQVPLLDIGLRAF